MHATGQWTATSAARRLQGPADLLPLYAALSDRGRRADTMLFETAAGRSIMLVSAAVRISCRGGEVRIEALSAGGRPVLDFLGRRFESDVASSDEQALVLEFERSDEVDAERRLKAPSPFDVPRAIIQGFRNATPDEPMTLCLPGIIAFDHVDVFEDLPANAEDPTQCPDFIVWLAESLVVADPGRVPRLVCTSFGPEGAIAEQAREAAARLEALATRAANPPAFVPEAGMTSSIGVDLDDMAFATMVTLLKDHVGAGDVYQIVPSRTFSAPCPDPLSAFARLRAIDRTPYTFFASMAGAALFGASPETSVRIAHDNGRPILEVKPIAGTRPRGSTPDEDDRMEADLRLDAKESAEHMMLVDLARNDVARVSVPGSRHVDSLMSIEKYARVMHIVSSVKGELAPPYDALHALQACLNVGTLSGAPKLRATQLLRRHERRRRGPYGGAIGWLNGNGELDTAVVIRSALVKDGIAQVRAGAGVVHDSDPEAEAEETKRKASAILEAIAGAQR